jgi:hypothetical protein
MALQQDLRKNFKSSFIPLAWSCKEFSNPYATFLFNLHKKAEVTIFLEIDKVKP